MRMCPDGATLEFVWKDKLIDIPTFKKCVTFYASLSERYKLPYLLIDARLSRFVVTPAVQEWHDRSIVPRYLCAGVKAMALLIPIDIFSELTHRQTFKKKNAAEALPSAFFRTREDAISWLQSW